MSFLILIKIKKTITGAIKGISYDEILNLKRTAEYVNEVMELNDSLKKREDKLISEKEKLVEMRENLKKTPIDKYI